MRLLDTGIVLRLVVDQLSACRGRQSPVSGRQAVVFELVPLQHGDGSVLSLERAAGHCCGWNDQLGPGWTAVSMASADSRACSLYSNTETATATAYAISCPLGAHRIPRSSVEAAAAGLAGTNTGRFARSDTASHSHVLHGKEFRSDVPERSWNSRRSQ